jgi:hypothetical protein
MMELLPIDRDTLERTFEQQLRWNGMHCLLAGGLQGGARSERIGPSREGTVRATGL